MLRHILISLYLKFGLSRRPQNLKKIFVVLLTRASCSVRATAYLSKSRRRFLKTNVDLSYYTNFKNSWKCFRWFLCQIDEFNVNGFWQLCFSAPITEEHAWAIVFECVKCLHSMVESKPRKVFIVTNTKQILLHQEGRVHESTFLIPGSTENEDQENPVSSKNNFIFSLKPL